jgi:hypothetical protein
VRRLVPLLAALLLAGCGGGDDDGGGRAPQGPPAERHGEAVLLDFGSIETVRAELVAASDGYVAGFEEDALAHVLTAESSYTELLSHEVGAEDSLLDRELRAAFDRLEADIRDRRGLRGVRTRAGYVSGQLLDGALAALVPRDAREDPGVKADVMRRLLDPLEAEYESAGSSPENSEEARLAAQSAYGLLGRVQTLARSVGKDFGPQLDAVSDGLAAVREPTWPVGIASPALGREAEVATALDRVRAALIERFALV